MNKIMVRAQICCPLCHQRVGIQRNGLPVAHWTVPGIALVCPQSLPRWVSAT